MAVNEEYLNFIQDQLSQFKGYETKKMFGGIGFFKDGKMFGLIGKNVFHLKADETNKADFESHGMKAFMSDAKKKGMPYWEVPLKVLENRSELSKWAQKSHLISINKK